MKTCKGTILQTRQLITLVLLGLCNTGCWALEMFPISNLSVLNLESCGGLIPIQGLLPRGSILLNYHSKNTSAHGEKCLWTLDTANNGYRYSFKAKITLLVSGTVDSHSGLSVVDWKSTGTDGSFDWILSHQELTPSAPIYESKTWDYNLYLSHSSRKGPATGFLLLVSLFDTETYKSRGHNFGWTDQCGNKSYGIAKSYDKFSMSISPPRPGTTLTVNSLSSEKNISSCSGRDSLDIYEIRVKNCPNRLVRLCGTIPSPISYTSQYPLLITFYTSDGGKVKTKFMISWE